VPTLRRAVRLKRPVLAPTSRPQSWVLWCGRTGRPRRLAPAHGAGCRLDLAPAETRSMASRPKAGLAPLHEAGRARAHSTPRAIMCGRPSPLNSRSPNARDTASTSHTRPSATQPPAACTRAVSAATVSPRPHTRCSVDRSTAWPLRARACAGVQAAGAVRTRHRAPHSTRKGLCLTHHGSQPPVAAHVGRARMCCITGTLPAMAVQGAEALNPERIARKAQNAHGAVLRRRPRARRARARLRLTTARESPTLATTILSRRTSATVAVAPELPSSPLPHAARRRPRVP
jgi:hypothetical protein